MPDHTFTNIRKRILKARGISLTRPSLKHHRKMETTYTPPSIPDKTDLMKLVEFRSGKSVEEILLSGSLRHIEKEYGIDHSTASKWRKLLAIKSLESIKILLTPEVITGGNNGSTKLEGFSELASSSSPGDNI